MLALLVLSGVVAFIVSGVLIRWAWRHAQDYDIDKPQRFHMGDVPRLGGVAILAGMLLGWLAGAAATEMRGVIGVQLSAVTGAFWGVLVVPAVLAGIYEDLTQRLSVFYRLLLTASTAVLACWLLDLSVSHLALPGIDLLIANFPWLGILLAAFAICGLPHAFNIIDGYNGLAGTVAIIIGLALAYVALQLGDRQLAAIVLCMVGATVGFLWWNYPRGLIFAGDGGAYLWGVVIAVGSVSLVQHHSQVSPWFPMLLLIYPVWETAFSIYRKLVRGGSPGVADALHFHQLIYRRIVRGVFDDDAERHMLIRNNRTSPYLWGFTLLTVVPAVLFWYSTPILMICCLLFIVLYVSAYLMLIRFKVPSWMQRR